MEIIEHIDKSKLRVFSREHLYYEIRMLFGVARELKDGTSNIYIYNALLESFVIHASIILDFFYLPQESGDDARAVHYVKDQKKWKTALPLKQKQFSIFHQKRNKEVVHLSYKRLEVHPGQKRWYTSQIVKKIRKVVNIFLDHADPDCLDPRLYELRSEDVSYEIF